MVSLIEELEARESAARGRVEELEAKIAELVSRLDGEREAWSRLRITRETVAGVIADISGPSQLPRVSRLCRWSRWSRCRWSPRSG